jgi:hypothetical protein
VLDRTRSKRQFDSDLPLKILMEMLFKIATIVAILNRMFNPKKVCFFDFSLLL